MPGVTIPSMADRDLALSLSIRLFHIYKSKQGIRRTMRKASLFLLTTALVSFAFSGPVRADDWHRHGDFHYDHYDHWHDGRWFNGFHDGRTGWWWIVDGLWYFYPAPFILILIPTRRQLSWSKRRPRRRDRKFTTTARTPPVITLRYHNAPHGNA